MQSREIASWTFAAVAAAIILGGAFQSFREPEAEAISGQAKVIDGDSLEIGSISIRLHAIDAFEGRQTCGDGSSRWDCGRAATNKLRALAEARTVSCEKVDIDTYGRTVAVCRADDVDLGAKMVRSGLALAYRQFGDAYVDEEDDARVSRRGAWNGTFTAPWDERNGRSNERPGQRPDSATTPEERTSGNCTAPRIKGNVNREGERIYHVPGSRWYDATTVDELNGERWFCTEQEAREAGWRAPRGA